jgi:hypothetical protein
MHTTPAPLRGLRAAAFAIALALGLVPVLAIATPLQVETFDISPVLASVQTSGAWYVDRYAPAGFTKATFDGDKRLKLSISSADSLANRPLAYQSTFYNTQGRDYDLPQTTSVVTADLYVGSDWEGASRRADLWANAVDGSSGIVGFPILGFTSGTGFRVWDNLGWHVAGYPTGFAYGRWYTLRMELTADSMKYYVDDQLMYTTAFADDTDLATSVGMNDVKLQAYNYGESYDIYFDNIGPMAPTPAPHHVTTTSGGNGALSPVNPGADAGDVVTVTVVPDAGYHIADVLVDGVSVGASSTVVFSNITANHTVSAEFAINTYTLAASAGAGGLVSPSGVSTKLHGSSAAYAFTPYPGFHVADVLVDGVSVGTPSDYTFSNIDDDHTLAVSFARTTYTVTSTVGSHGSASWSGPRAVVEGSNLTIVFTPADGFVIADVLVDGVSQGALGSYTFTDISANHEVAVTFAEKTFAISAVQSANGTIAPDAVTNVGIGQNATFTVAPATGYHVADVLVDGGSVGAVTTYVFRNVSSAHTISAVFAVNPKVRLSRPHASALASKKGNVKVWGTLKPRHAKGTRPVRIYRWKRVGGSWKAYGYVRAKVANYKTYSKYARTVHLPSKGRWKLRAFAPADGAHASTWSTKSDYVRAR